MFVINKYFTTMNYKFWTLFLFQMLLLSGNSQTNEFKSLIDEGKSLYNKGDYRLAIQQFDKILEQSPKNILVLAEKARSLMMLNKYEEVALICRKSIEIDAYSKDLKTIYTIYANSYDMMGQPKKALAIYDEGIEKFPDYFHLYFNKGITYSQMDKIDKAIQSFEKSIIIKPNHAGSHNALARMHFAQENKVQALMAFSRFVILEPKGRRAELNLNFIKDITKGNAQETGPNSITLSLDLTTLPEEEQMIENDFSATALLLSLNAGMSFTNKNKKKTEVQLFEGNIKTVCESLEELEKENSGFYWKYYAPYFIALNNNDFSETFSYIAFASSQDKQVTKWLEKNKEKVNAFYEWSNKFEWRN